MTTSPADDLPCREVVELVTDHLEGALPTATQQRLLLHLSECDGCASYLEQMHATGALAGALPPEEVPPGLTAALLASFRRATRPSGPGPA